VLTLLKVLLFGTWVSLTPDPIYLGQPGIELDLEEPISAITAGAHLRIDISEHITDSDVISRLEQAAKFIESGCLSAILSTGENVSVTLDELGRSGSEDSTHLTLSSASGVPTDVEFVKVSITSCKPIGEVLVKWANYKM
jgi:hypothetical protein